MIERPIAIEIGSIIGGDEEIVRSQSSLACLLPMPSGKGWSVMCGKQFWCANAAWDAQGASFMPWIANASWLCIRVHTA